MVDPREGLDDRISELATSARAYAAGKVGLSTVVGHALLLGSSAVPVRDADKLAREAVRKLGKILATPTVGSK